VSNRQADDLYFEVLDVHQVQHILEGLVQFRNVWPVLVLWQTATKDEIEVMQLQHVVSALYSSAPSTLL
jgi:hypothetical protein